MLALCDRGAGQTLYIGFKGDFAMAKEPASPHEEAQLVARLTVFEHVVGHMIRDAMLRSGKGPDDILAFGPVSRCHQRQENPACLRSLTNSLLNFKELQKRKGKCSFEIGSRGRSEPTTRARATCLPAHDDPLTERPILCGDQAILISSS